MRQRFMFPDLTFTSDPMHSNPGREPSGLLEWMNHIREQDMPAFGATVAAVTSIASDDRASVSKLSQVILRDAAMTAKVLKLANSAFHNPARQSISTISRSIVLLGFDVVSHIAMVISLVDALLKGGVRQRVVEEMARSFHAAVQARALAMARRDPKAEEVFIAALLARIGEMAFWCFGGSKAEQLDQMLRGSSQKPEELQQQLLGFKLHQLTAGLVHDWKLSPMLLSVFEHRTRLGPSEQAIVLGQQFALAAEKGWESPELRQLVRMISAHAEVPEDELRPVLLRNTEEAVRLTRVYGAHEASRQIPLPAASSTLQEEEPVEAEEPAKKGPDPMLQLRILRELSSLIASGGSLNAVLNLALEGMFRGIGMDQVLFALMAPNRTQLIGKVGLGAGGESLAQRFVFSIDNQSGDLINEVVLRQKSFCIVEGKLPPGIRMDRLSMLSNPYALMIAPIVAQGKTVGLFYAARASRPAPSNEDRESFQHFVQQVSMAFNNLATQAGRRG